MEKAQPLLLPLDQRGGENLFSSSFFPFLIKGKKYKKKGSGGTKGMNCDNVPEDLSCEDKITPRNSNATNM